MRRLLPFMMMLLPLTALEGQATVSIIGGLTSSTLAVSNSTLPVSYQSRSGYAAGVQLAAPLGKGYVFAPAALYVQKGFSTTSGGVTSQVRASYVEIPAVLRADGPAARTRLSILAGPYLAFKVGCNVAVNDGSSSSSTDCSTASGGQDDAKSFDFGATVGAGIEAGKLTLSARRDFGLINAVQASGTNPPTYKNRSWLFLASVTLK